jgi:GT2 family glycosyltransferase
MTVSSRENPTIHILLPVHNRKEITRQCVRCLLDQTYRGFHLILLDDGSTDGTAEMVLEHLPETTVIRGKGDWWWSGALDQGFKWLQGTSGPNDIVAIMNDDTVFEPDFLQNAVTILSNDPHALLLAECYSQGSGRKLHAGVHADWRRFRFEAAQRPEDINCLCTMGLFLRVHTFLTIGGFYPRLLPHFLSDYEFTMRAHRMGFSLITHPSLKLSLREETTWNREIQNDSFFRFMKMLFSKRSAYNPLAWTAFIALACPFPWKPINWLRVWAGTGVVLTRRAFGQVNVLSSGPFQRVQANK